MVQDDSNSDDQPVVTIKNSKKDLKSHKNQKDCKSQSTIFNKKQK